MNLYQEVVQLQDACNIIPIANWFGKNLDRLRALICEEQGCQFAGTDAIASHPITRAWADKVAHLTGTQGFTDASQEAMSICMQKA